MQTHRNEHATHDDANARAIRRVCLVARELLKAEPFDSIADLVDALLCRCARLRIPCPPAVLEGALTALDRVIVLTHEHPRACAVAVVPHDAPDPPRDVAARLVADFARTVRPLRRDGAGNPDGSPIRGFSAGAGDR